MESNKLRGFTEAIVSAAAFGLIPLFSIPALADGMRLPSLVVYRFTFGAFILLLILIYNRQSLRLRFGESLRIMFLSLLYAISAVSLISGYAYLPSGVATTLVFSYPVWTAILMIIFFHEHLTLRTVLAILLAVAGVCLLSGIEKGISFSSITGIALELLSGLTYAIYMVAFPAMKVRHLSTLKVTFYVFFFTILLLVLYASFTEGGIQPIISNKQFVNLALLGLLPTAVSNITLIMALKRIESTTVAILGAFEPITAMSVGCIVFGEPLTIMSCIGFALIIVAVILLILKKTSYTNE